MKLASPVATTNKHENQPIPTLTRKKMLNDKELSELESLLQSLGIDLPESLELEVAGVAIIRFCLAKALRKHQLLIRK